ncbi:hypothetical protein LXL04_031550 [Taraxacum kok-saghyz]
MKLKARNERGIGRVTELIFVLDLPLNFMKPFKFYPSERFEGYKIKKEIKSIEKSIALQPLCQNICFSKEILFKPDKNYASRSCSLFFGVARDEAASRSFENSYIPENPRTPKPLTFSKNRLRGAKNRSILSPFAKIFFRKSNFLFSKTLHMGKFFFLPICTSLYNTYLKSFVKKNLKKNAKKKRILIIMNVLESPEVGFLKGITE